MELTHSSDAMVVICPIPAFGLGFQCAATPPPDAVHLLRAICNLDGWLLWSTVVIQGR